jgi:hypothetical protein
VTNSRWKKGTSGNPAGRKPGTGQIGKLRESIAKEVPAVLDAMVAKAREGDVGAARLLLERAIPALKPVEQPIVMPMPGGTLTEHGRTTLQAVATGELAPGQGAALLSAIGNLARLVDVEELARRIEEIELRHGIERPPNPRGTRT